MGWVGAKGETETFAFYPAWGQNANLLGKKGSGIFELAVIMTHPNDIAKTN